MDLFFGGILSLWLLAAAVPVGLVVLGIVALTNRREDDPEGRRATAVYLGVVCFVALFTVLFAGTAAVGKAASLIVPTEDRGVADGGWFAYSPDSEVVYSEGDGDWIDPPGQGPELPDRLLDEVDDETVRGAIWAGLIVLPAAFVYRFHARRRRDLVDGEGFVGSGAWRSDRVYLYLVCTVAVAAATVATAMFLFDVVRMVAPDITTGLQDRRSEREKGLADAITMLVLGLGATAIFFTHWSQVSGEPSPLRRRRGSRGEEDDG